MADPGFDIDRAHRWFAIELNNIAWDLVESPERDATETERMIHAAHASAWHWLHAGDALNHQRAECLVAAAHLAAGHAQAADRHAQRSVELGDANGDSQSGFDVAGTHGCAAVAARLVGDDERADRHARTSTDARQELDADDRALLDKLFPLG